MDIINLYTGFRITVSTNDRYLIGGCTVQKQGHPPNFKTPKLMMTH